MRRFGVTGATAGHTVQANVSDAGLLLRRYSFDRRRGMKIRTGKKDTAVPSLPAFVPTAADGSSRWSITFGLPLILTAFFV
jgi:hypothetical protein